MKALVHDLGGVGLEGKTWEKTDMPVPPPETRAQIAQRIVARAADIDVEAAVTQRDAEGSRAASYLQQYRLLEHSEATRTEELRTVTTQRDVAGVQAHVAAQEATQEAMMLGQSARALQRVEAVVVEARGYTESARETAWWETPSLGVAVVCKACAVLACRVIAVGAAARRDGPQPSRLC